MDILKYCCKFCSIWNLTTYQMKHIVNSFFSFVN
uniref:Uncharacterized protein n=1 Tax=Arundo donax TaxID=35708 RepID=A0A0A9FGZ7_ARUDO